MEKLKELRINAGLSQRELANEGWAHSGSRVAGGAPWQREPGDAEEAG